MTDTSSTRSGRWCAAVAVAVAVLSAALRADTVYMLDGSSYKGKVRIDGDQVIVEVPNGSITLDRDRIARIESGQDPFAELTERQARLSPRDAQGFYELGLWAKAHDLTRNAKELFAKAVEIDPGHMPANLALGRLFIDSGWCDVPAVIGHLNAWLDADMNEAALRGGRQTLDGLLTPDQRVAVLRITAQAARRLGMFSQARADYQGLADASAESDPGRQRSSAIAQVLGDNPSGLYLVQLDRFAEMEARNGEESGAIRRSGFCSLARDNVLEIALRERAKAIIAAGQEIMDQAKNAEITDDARATTLYRQADQQFGKADAIDADIARSYRVEAARGMVRIHQARAESNAQRFDGLNQRLKLDLKTGDKRDYIRNLKVMLKVLDDIQAELEAVLNLAVQYKAEFKLVIGWTQDDLATTKAMRRTLQGELQSVGG